MQTFQWNKILNDFPDTIWVFPTQSAFTCLKLTIETLEKAVNFEYISHFLLVFLLLTLNM